MDQSEYTELRTAIDKLTLNDSSVAVHPDSSSALGQGWRLGFLGLLHMDVFRQRLEEVGSRLMVLGVHGVCASVLATPQDFKCCSCTYMALMQLFL